MNPLAGSQSEAPAQAENRVQDKSLAVTGFLQGAHRAGERSPAADEPAPVALKAQRFTLGLLKCKAVRNINGRVTAASRPAVGQERSLFRKRLCLDEQLVERRMLTIRIVRRQRELNVTRQIESAGAQRTIYQRHTPNLNVIFRGDDNLGFTLYPMIDAPEHGAVQREVGKIVINLPAGWLIGTAP